MAALQENICRKIEARLAKDREWRSTPIGRLARALIDRHTHIPLNIAADFIEVPGVMLRRWLYGRYNPAQRQTKAIERVELLIKALDYAYENELLPAPTASRVMEALTTAAEAVATQ